MATATYDLLDSTTLSSSASSVTFTSIDQSYRDLVVAVDYLGDSGTNPLRAVFNGDTTNYYIQIGMRGNGSTADSPSWGNQTKLLLLQGADASNVTRASTVLQVMDYSATDKHKTCLEKGGQVDERTIAAVTRYTSTSAISTIEIFTVSSNMVAGSTISIYGISA